ncbi:N-acetylmuramoyl-L-alanine amidase [Lysobacter daejeonensis GH1-9]|uniref:N-acetylmuramoyl-L-alanine amidase AmiC n=1 Tax=Lysobacter daejeonensis GH1-9 TaxID=1385517 RepID=A0A0A0EYI8_9GAMM|nr:N-acetylmuramoyl-L-alanine amidase [Lysobacter daejeonensis GH1-9]
MKGATVQKFLLGTALLSALAWNFAHASEIKSLELHSGATGTRAEIALDQSAEFKVISLQGPDRLVVDLPASALGKGVTMPVGAGVVKSIRAGQPAPGTARIVFDLVEKIAVLKPRLEPAASGAILVLEWPGDGAAMGKVESSRGSTVAAVAVPAPAASKLQTPPTAIAPTSADPTAASSAATTRLISQIAAGLPANGGGTSNAASGQHVASAAGADTPATVAPSTASTSTMPGDIRVATGAPTRVASGAVTPTTVSTATATAKSSAADDEASRAAAVKTLQDVMTGRGARPLVIAIDAGHGGQDPGAMGMNGTREKDVTLAISRELARQINATPGLRAYLTRDRDLFLPLPQRARLARAAKADMFISIHADAAENRNADGSSVYVLSLKGASSQRARWLANKENSSDLIGGVRLEKANNTLASVLLDLTQSGHMRASEEAADHVLSGLKRVGNNHKPHVERANFAVLRTSDMPSMLVETAFISNPEEERRLNDPAFVRKIAGAVVDGVNTYFTRQPPPGTYYAARAKATEVASAGAAAAGGSP